MHEVSLMQDTVIIATRQAREAGAQRIHRVAMKVGALSGAVPETLEFAFEIVAKGTIAEGATLDIERVPVRASVPRVPRNSSRRISSASARVAAGPAQISGAAASCS